ncbi:MAG: universal stress protein [Chloroflexota bacterium]|jgi:nucleotide-binding universal stress UspA family protein
MESYASAVNDFRRARNRAALQEILGQLTGKSTELLSYEEVRQKLRASGVVSRSVREIPLDAIVGSAGRYNDFTRNFLPKSDSDQDRWARVKVAQSDMGGLPPIEVYQIGDIYFVYDGHHRVSIARQLGVDSVQAYVTEIRSRVPLTPDVKHDDLIIIAEYVEFLNHTKLDVLRPDADLRATCPGQYQKLLDHIDVHRHYMGLEQEREIPYEEAVAHWYDHVYLPVVKIIRELGILHDFPDRTETDLYLWIGKHRLDIEEWLGWEIPTSEAAIDLADRESTSWTRTAARIGRRVLDVVVPDELGEPTIQKERAIEKVDEPLFASILVGISGDEMGWLALEQAIEVAKLEKGRLRGLYVVPEEDLVESEETFQIRDRFFWRCGEVGLAAKFVIDVETGSIAQTLCERARWSDLVVVSLAHPPDDSAISRWASGFRTLIRRCARPVLAVPGQVSPMSRPLLAYDGSPKAKEALYVATYLSGSWNIPLLVVSAAGDGVEEETLEDARAYLEGHQIEAEFIWSEGPAAEILLAIAEEQEADLFILGGYGGHPVVEVVLGNVVDTLLGSSEIPMLICR